MLCDIVDMNSCHMLLGRPWQYVCGAMHGFFKNVITIVKDGRKHALMPLQKEELNKRNLSVGSKIELKISKNTKDYFVMKACGMVKTETRKYKRNKGKHVQVEDLEDTYVKNQFEICVLNPLRCSLSS